MTNKLVVRYRRRVGLALQALARPMVSSTRVRAHHLRHVETTRQRRLEAEPLVAACELPLKT